MKKTNRVNLGFILITALAVIVAGCGDDEHGSATTQDGTGLATCADYCDYIIECHSPGTDFDDCIDVCEEYELPNEDYWQPCVQQFTSCNQFNECIDNY